MSRESNPLLPAVERIVVSSVALTARALSEVTPELTLLQWRVLVLADREGGVKVSTVAEGLDSKLAATSRLIGRLRTRGLVETRPSEADGRVVLVSLTERGMSLRTQVVQRRRSEILASLTDLAPTDTAVAVLGLLADALEDAS